LRQNRKRIKNEELRDLHACADDGILNGGYLKGGKRQWTGRIYLAQERAKWLRSQIIWDFLGQCSTLNIASNVTWNEWERV
jgi:hypothetical protein